MSATYTIDNSILEKMIKANQMMSEALTELFIQKKREETKEKEEVWIVTKDAAEIALMSGAGVRYLINTEQIKWKKNGGRYLVLKDSLMTYLTKEKTN
ncbi:MAG: hypothetical protein PQJ49_11220 [Sphaerochaetaceae bacterium]|jgi:hypothetical protein|nr:hypothetical protein [Sphaerochaetaceae bacterium]